jgi:predicted Zn-dependent protease
MDFWRPFHRETVAASMRAQGALRLFFAFALALLVALPAHAVQLLRDPDIEHALRKLAEPVLQAAGLNPNRVRILIVNDSALNAFIIDSDAIFINYGLILKLDEPEMLQGVIAHEAAHIVNGHISRRMANLRNARTVSGLGMALAAVAAASGQGEAATGLALGTSSSAQRSFLAHTRSEEASADQSGVRFLKRAGISPSGMLKVLQIFEGQELLIGGRQDPYARSHPLSRDRVRAMEAFVAAFGDTSTPDADRNYWYARARGKISAFTRSPKWTFGRAKEGPTQDITLMRQAIAHHRNSNATQAVKAIDAAIALRPSDPFFYELKGQILLESRQISAAVTAYKKAVDLAPKDALILSGYGRALLANEQYGAALQVLENARARDFRDTRLLRDLSVAYARQGQNGMASLVTAERYALQGRLKDAEIHAKRASGLLPAGSGPWQRAQDVIIAAERS